jgi:excisionase family DNA binding protein
MSDELLNIEQAAEILSVSKRSLYEWRMRGKGPQAVKIGRELRYRRTDVDAYLDALFEAAKDERV